MSIMFYIRHLIIEERNPKINSEHYLSMSYTFQTVKQVFMISMMETYKQVENFRVSFPCYKGQSIIDPRRN